MTEHNSLAREYSFDDRKEDPLEELARIVSGEKKPAPKPEFRPVQQTEAVQTAPRHLPAAHEDQVAHDDYDVDVDFESELMQELDDGVHAATFDKAPASAPEEQVEMAEEPAALEADFGSDTTAFDDFDAIVGDIAAAAEEEDADDATLEDQLMVELGLSSADTGEFITGFEDDAPRNMPKRQEVAEAPEYDEAETYEAAEEFAAAEDFGAEAEAEADFAHEDFDVPEDFEAAVPAKAYKPETSRQSLQTVGDFKDKFESELALNRAAKSLNMNAHLNDPDEDDDLAELGFDPSIWDQPAPQPNRTAAPRQDAASGLNFDSAFQAEMATMDNRQPAAEAPRAARPERAVPQERMIPQERAMPQERAPAHGREMVRAAPVTTPPSMFNSEREIDDHFAAVFAEELGFDEQPARAEAPVARHAVAAPARPAVPAARAYADRRETAPAMANGHAGYGRSGGDMYEDDYAESYAPKAYAPQTRTPDAYAPDAYGEGYDEYNAYEDDEGDYNEARDEGYDAPRLEKRRGSGARGFRLAGIALGLALVVGLGAVSYGFFRGGGTPSEPVIVKADTEPVKTRPENPGGTTVANQDNAAYERVSGKFGEEAKQEKLVSDVEEPVNLVTSAPPIAPEIATSDASSKGDARLSPGEQQALVSPTTLQPRRVRTLTVRRDGTIIQPPAEPAAVTSEAASTDAIPLDGASNTGAIPVPSPRPDHSAAPRQPATSSTEPTTLPGVTIGQSVVPVVPVPSTDPVTTQSVVPVDQPRAVALAPVEKPAPAEQAIASQAELSEWVVQVSSQRSPEDAQASYRNLVNRFPNLLEGRQMAVQKADIPDKGVFYRVRIGSQSKEDATDFCQRLQSAGGACFVTR